MKAVIALAAATGAMATMNCQIPARYTKTTGTACAGPNDGYTVAGVCLTGLDRVQFPAQATAEDYVAMTTTNANAFTSGAATSLTGCVAPSILTPWTAAGAGTFGADLSAKAGSCTTLAPAAIFATATSAITGVDIRCATDYYPTVGVEGTAICGSSTATGPWPAAATTPTADYWFTPAAFAGVNPTASAAPSSVGLYTNNIEMSGDDMLMCAKACPLPASICQNNMMVANVIGWGNMVSTCMLRPNHAKKYPTSFSFRCANTAANTATGVSTWTVSCATNDAVPLTTYAGECGVVSATDNDGAMSSFLINRNGNLNSWANTITQTAGQVSGYATVTSTLTKMADVAGSSFSTKREAAFQNGAMYKLTVAGCSTIATAAERATCVQAVLNWWRCYYGFPFDESTTCYSNAVVIACPTDALGFTCPSESKKGLLGLLGLLILIPIFLILCCLLLLCCIRRRKTEADVHFATFDPHAAPVMGTAHCAPMTACAGSFAPATMPVM